MPSNSEAHLESRVDRNDLVAIFLVSAALMLYQIALTRVLSVVAWYHFAFLTISIVMLGIGAPGVWFSYVKRPERHLGWLLLSSAITVPVSIALIVEFGALLIERSVLYVVACVLPATVSLGAVVCLILVKARGAAVTRAYAADLVGAGLAAVLVVPLMHAVPTPQLAAGAGLLPLVPLVLRRNGYRWVALGTAAVTVLTLVQGDLYRVTRSKIYDEARVQPIYEHWSPTARITVFDERGFRLLGHKPGDFGWGEGTRAPKQRLRQYWLEQDGSAGTPSSSSRGTWLRSTHSYSTSPPRAISCDLPTPW